MAVIFDFFPDSIDMNHDGSAVAGVVVAPDFFKEKFFGKDFVGVLGKKFQKFKFVVKQRK